MCPHPIFKYIPIASPSSLVEPVNILSTATTILCDDVSPIASCKLAIFLWSRLATRATEIDSKKSKINYHYRDNKHSILSPTYFFLLLKSVFLLNALTLSTLEYKHITVEHEYFSGMKQAENMLPVTAKGTLRLTCTCV